MLENQYLAKIENNFFKLDVSDVWPQVKNGERWHYYLRKKDQEAIPSPLHLLNLLMSIFILLSA
jgi:hypothetical protein